MRGEARLETISKGNHTMSEYRIAESIRRFWIEVRHDGKEWHDLSAIPRVPRYFDSLADARSWVATIKRGVVYHDAEDASSLKAGDELVCWIKGAFYGSIFKVQDIQDSRGLVLLCIESGSYESLKDIDLSEYERLAPRSPQ
jgi:hypothetical protein